MFRLKKVFYILLAALMILPLVSCEGIGDGAFMGTTQSAHRISCNNISTGRHKLTVVDQLGNSQSVIFTVPK